MRMVFSSGRSTCIEGADAGAIDGDGGRRFDDGTPDDGDVDKAL